MQKLRENILIVYRFAIIVFLIIAIAIIELAEAEYYQGILPVILKIADNILLAILASYVFLIIINSKRRLVINDYLVIRKRDNLNDSLSLSLLVGNRDWRWLGKVYDLKCSFTYNYRDSEKSNSAIVQTAERCYISGYYRFSVDLREKSSKRLNSIQKEFWKQYLKYRNESAESNSSITVTISGSSNVLGGLFRYSKDFPFDKIIIGEDYFGARIKAGKGDPTKWPRLKDLGYEPAAGLQSINRFSSSCFFKSNYWKIFKTCYKYTGKKETTAKNELKALIEKHYAARHCHKWRVYITRSCMSF